MEVTASNPVKMKQQYIRGFRSDSYSSDMMRIVYVAETGLEGNFDWLINGKRYRVCAGDFVLFNLRITL